MGCFICQWFRTELYSQTIFFRLIMKNCSEITSVYTKMINCEQTLRLKGTNTILVELHHSQKESISVDPF